MLLSRTKPAQTTGDAVATETKKSKVPSLDDFIKNRDFTGALTLLEFTRNSGKGDIKNDLWIAYCAFHLSDYKRAMEEYNRILKHSDVPSEVWTYLGCCYFYLGMYKEADSAVSKESRELLAPVQGATGSSNEENLQSSEMSATPNKINDGKKNKKIRRGRPNSLKSGLKTVRIVKDASLEPESKESDIKKSLKRKNRDFDSNSGRKVNNSKKTFPEQEVIEKKVKVSEKSDESQKAESSEQLFSGKDYLEALPKDEPTSSKRRSIAMILQNNKGNVKQKVNIYEVEKRKSPCTKKK